MDSYTLIVLLGIDRKTMQCLAPTFSPRYLPLLLAWQVKIASNNAQYLHSADIFIPLDSTDVLREAMVMVELHLAAQYSMFIRF